MKRTRDTILQFPQPPLADWERGHSEAKPKLTNEKTEMLLHELHVHQLELEMQNNELRRAQEEIETSLERYVSLYDFAPIGYLTLSEHGVINEANLTCAKLLGKERGSILKQNFQQFVFPQDHDCWYLNFNQVLQLRKNKSFEIRMLRANGSPLYARLDCLLLDTLPDKQFLIADTLAVRIALTDITEIKQAEQELRIAAAVFESQEGMMVTDINNKILKVNQSFTRITGYTTEDVIGKTPRLLRSGRHDEEFYAGIWSSILSKGAWQGEIWNRQKNGDVFPVWLTITAVVDHGITTHYVATLTDITSRKAAEDEMQMLAFYDPLTDLPNRRLLLDRMHRAIASSSRTAKYCALMFIDLDNFKILNDSLGHDTGDLMLQVVAHRLTICVREGDTVARMGGDEFMVMLENLSEYRNEAEILAENIGHKVLASIAQPFCLSGQECFSSASIGVTLFNSHRYTIPELQKQADLAMYKAKMGGRNILRFFKPEMLACKR